MKWNKSPIDSMLVREIASQYKVSLFEASVLVRRGITQGNEILYFLEQEFIYLHQPFLFKDMELAIDRIQSAKAEGEIVFVYGDKDVDGITSTAIMVRSLQEREIEVIWRVPTGNLGYGLSKEDIEYAQTQNATLILTIDCGISSIDEVIYAQELGMDVLIFDHHTPGIQVPQALAIIDPKVKEQGYPFEGICAATIAQKLRLALAFSETDIYNQDVVLMNTVPINKAYKIELLCVRNLVVLWSKTITVSSQDAEYQRDEVFSLLEGYSQIIVHNAATQVSLFQQALGNVDVGCLDLQPQVNKFFASFNGKSLLQIMNSSRMLRYLDKEPEEIDILFQLYLSVVFANYPNLKESFYDVVDLVAIATIADMMPLTNENRILYKMGIAKLEKDPGNNLKPLLALLNLDKKRIDSRAIGWDIGPVINSSGRMGQANVAVEMLLASEHATVIENAEKLLSLNHQRKKQMEKLKAEIHEDVESNLDKNKSFVFIYHDTLPHTFTGMVAGKYSRQLKVPVIILAKRSDEIITGSIRCSASFNAPKLIQELQSYFIDGGGHKAAGGFSFSYMQKKICMEEIQNYLEENTSEDTGQEDEHLVDIEIPEKMFNFPEVKQMQQAFEPYGQAWLPIQYLFTNVRVDSCEIVGKGGEHIKFMVLVGGVKIPALIWQFSEYNYTFEQLTAIKNINMIVQAKIDMFRDEEQFSLIIQDFEPV